MYCWGVPAAAFRTISEAIIPRTAAGPAAKHFILQHSAPILAIPIPHRKNMWLRIPKSHLKLLCMEPTRKFLLFERPI